MKTAKLFLLPLMIFLIVNGGCNSSTPPATNYANAVNGIAIPLAPSLAIAGTEANVMPMSVGCGYINEPCVTVTICAPGAAVGSSTCVSVSNVLLDTGSYGLRIFSSAIPFNLKPEVDPASNLPIAECVSYLDGSSDWGPVVTADVLLGNGNERAANVPLQLIDSTFGQIPKSCTDPDTNPAADGFNGILGVGLFTQDCGDSCVNDALVGEYFVCPTGAVCTGITAALSLQVSNPVNYLPTDNNGVIMQLPNIASPGVATATGYVILGIGTQADNTPPAGVTVLAADGNGEFQTYFGGQLYTQSFIDSGSNAYFIPNQAITLCDNTGADAGFFCGTAPESLTAVQLGALGNPQDLLSFEITMAPQDPSIRASSGLGGPAEGYFDWGLPFFFGKTIYVGTDGQNSPLGAGPYWGF